MSESRQPSRSTRFQWNFYAADVVKAAIEGDPETKPMAKPMYPCYARHWEYHCQGDPVCFFLFLPFCPAPQSSSSENIHIFSDLNLTSAEICRGRRSMPLVPTPHILDLRR